MLFGKIPMLNIINIDFMGVMSIVSNNLDNWEEGKNLTRINFFKKWSSPVFLM